MNRIDLNLKNKSCPILFGNSALSLFQKEIKKTSSIINYFIVIDENVLRLHKTKIENTFRSSGKVYLYSLKSGEQSKSPAELNKIYSSLLKNNFTKDTLLIAVGGGVTGDVSAYAASTFMRGIPCIHIPTTLLSMIDSSIGGKTGINFDGRKNLVGTIYQPEMVLSDLEFLNTLPEVEFNSGLGEAVKYAFIEGEDLFCFMNENYNQMRNSPEKLPYLIEKCIKVKAAVVEKDENEKGLRKILNLGHTFGHAIESALENKIKHGEAVVLGIISSLFLSNMLGIFTDDQLKEYLKLPLKFKFPGNISSLNIAKTINMMKSDKKSYNGKEKFVLVQKPGSILLDMEAERYLVLSALKKLKSIV